MSRDEFDGKLRSYIMQNGDNQQLTLDIICEPGTAITISLSPGPSAEWEVFRNGEVDLRFDDGSPVSEQFDDADTVLFTSDLPIDRLIGADTLTVRVQSYPFGLEVDTFNMIGLSPAMERADCTE